MQGRAVAKIAQVAWQRATSHVRRLPVTQRIPRGTICLWPTSSGAPMSVPRFPGCTAARLCCCPQRFAARRIAVVATELLDPSIR